VVVDVSKVGEEAIEKVENAEVAKWTVK